MSFTEMDPPRGPRAFGPGSGSYFGGSYSHRNRHEGYRGPHIDVEGTAEGPYRSERSGFSIRRSLRTAEDFLDERGCGAWIAAMVLGFVFFWPVGLALLAYMIWSKRMFKSFCARSANAFSGPRGFGHRSSGNAAFDAYRNETLRRLEEEQEAFESFLERLRAAKDKQEFDSFMEERVARARAEAAERGAEAERPA